MQQKKKYVRYFWMGKKHYQTKAVFLRPYPKPENVFWKIPKDYRYSTRNLLYHNANSSRVVDDYPYLFDYQEVALGYYIYPRVYYNKEQDCYETLPRKYWGAPLNVGSRSGTWPIEYVTEIYKNGHYIKLPSKDNIKRWRYFEEEQCNTSLIPGSMGEGKSNLMSMLINLCLDEEAVIMSADVYFEPRHLALGGTLRSIDYSEDDKPFLFDKPITKLPRTTNKITKVVVQTPVEIYFHEDAQVSYVHPEVLFEKENAKNNIYLSKYPNITVHTFHDSNDIIAALEAGKVVTVYDESFTSDTKNRFWFEIAYKLNRREKVDFTVVLAHHETSKLLPSHPFKTKFTDVQLFADEYVDFRHADIRFIGAQQLLSESFWRTNQKTTYIFYKNGSRIDYIRDAHKRSLIMSLAIDETLVEYKGSYSRHTAPLFPKIKGKFRILKKNDIIYGLEQLQAEEEAKKEAKKQELQEMYEFKENLRADHRDEEFNQKIQLQEARTINRISISEKEAQFTKEVELLKQETLKKKERLLELETKHKKELLDYKEQKMSERQQPAQLKKKLKEQKETIEFDKGKLILQANPDITTTRFGELLGITNFQTAKKKKEQLLEELSVEPTTNQ